MRGGRTIEASVRASERIETVGALAIATYRVVRVSKVQRAVTGRLVVPPVPVDLLFEGLLKKVRGVRKRVARVGFSRPYQRNLLHGPHSGRSRDGFRQGARDATAAERVALVAIPLRPRRAAIQRERSAAVAARGERC